MSRFSLHIIAGLPPFIPYGPSLAQQVGEVVNQCLWVNFITMETGVSFPAAA